MNFVNEEKAVTTTSLPASEQSATEREDVVSHMVPHKYRGTEADQRDMIVLGKKQVLRRNFKFITMLGFGSTVICSWEVVLPYECANYHTRVSLVADADTHV